MRKFVPRLFAAGSAIALAVPSAGLAVTATSMPRSVLAAIAPFTPANGDPEISRELAAQVAARGRTIRFTPAGSIGPDARTMTVAVRIDDSTARAISVRSAIAAAQAEAGLGTSIASIAPTRYNLGIARGYQSFAKPDTVKLDLPDAQMPDLASFQPSEGAKSAPGRLQPRISLEQDSNLGRAPRTLEGAGQQTVDLGGAFRLSRNLNVTAGVRLQQDRDRLAPLTDSVQDSKAVYVGTQFRF
ncbi:hypothetical protein [Tsuneonella mangrovi]|uniref:hypothetical protein n=1 Tax=Tsuneonella mangrovi TaxID=1982042 RepID=UPI001F0AF17B|nr:hypothetical protein [Tsuneonella mangrovi]